MKKHILPRDVKEALDIVKKDIGISNLIYSGMSYVRDVVDEKFGYLGDETMNAAKTVDNYFHYFVTPFDFMECMIFGYDAEPTQVEKNKERLERAMRYLQERLDAMRDFRNRMGKTEPSRGEMQLEACLIELRHIDFEEPEEVEEENDEDVEEVIEI